MEGIDISGLDKVKLLRLLWKEAAPAIMFSAGEVPFPKEAATEAVTGYIDGFAGRLIEMDLSKDQINPFYYDGEYGHGEVARIVAELRAELIK